MVRMFAGPGASPLLWTTSRRWEFLNTDEVKIYRIFRIFVEPDEERNGTKVCERTHFGSLTCGMRAWFRRCPNGVLKVCCFLYVYAVHNKLSEEMYTVHKAP
jgi:hypothetical protein